MVALTCCGNQPTPIIIGLLVTYLTGLIDCYPMLPSGSPSDSINLGKIVYRPTYSSHSSSSSPQSSSSSSSSSSDLSDSSSSPQSSISIVSSPSSAIASSSSPPVASQPSSMKQLSQPASSSYHHSPSYGSFPGIAFIRGQVNDDDAPLVNPRSRYHDYLDTFPLPLMSNGIERSGNNIPLMTPNGISSGTKGMKTPKFILAQPSPSQIDFDYVPYIQSDFNPLPSSSSLGSESRSGSSDLYEEPDYQDPIYDLKYDPIDDLNWGNEPASSYRQQQQQPVLPPLTLLSPQSSSYYSSYPLPSSLGNSGSSSEEMLANLMVDYIVKEMERNAQQQSLSQSSEPIQNLVRLQQQQQQHHHHPLQQQKQKQPIDELKAYESIIEKKSLSTPLSTSSSSLNRDKGSSTDKISNKKKESDSIKRIEQRGQKEYPMLRPATENNGKDEIDNQTSLTSQLQSLSSSSSTSASPTHQPIERADEEVNQLKSLLQSA